MTLTLNELIDNLQAIKDESPTGYLRGNLPVYIYTNNLTLQDISKEIIEITTINNSISYRVDINLKGTGDGKTR